MNQSVHLTAPAVMVTIPASRSVTAMEPITMLALLLMNLYISMIQITNVFIRTVLTPIDSKVMFITLDTWLSASSMLVVIFASDLLTEASEMLVLILAICAF